MKSRVLELNASDERGISVSPTRCMLGVIPRLILGNFAQVSHLFLCLFVCILTSFPYLFAASLIFSLFLDALLGVLLFITIAHSPFISCCIFHGSFLSILVISLSLFLLYHSISLRSLRLFSFTFLLFVIFLYRSFSCLGSGVPVCCYVAYLLFVILFVILLLLIWGQSSVD